MYFLRLFIVVLQELHCLLLIRISMAIGTQSGIRLYEREAMAKIWGSSKNDQNRITGKLLKFLKVHFHNSSFSPCCFSSSVSTSVSQ